MFNEQCLGRFWAFPLVFKVLKFTLNGAAFLILKKSWQFF